MLFYCGTLTGNEQMDRRFMFMKTDNPSGLSAKLIGIYPRSQMSVFTGPLVFLFFLFVFLYLFFF